MIYFGVLYCCDLGRFKRRLQAASSTGQAPLPVRRSSCAGNCHFYRHLLPAEMAPPAFRPFRWLVTDNIAVFGIWVTHPMLDTIPPNIRIPFPSRDKTLNGKTTSGAKGGRLLYSFKSTETNRKIDLYPETPRLCTFMLTYTQTQQQTCIIKTISFVRFLLLVFFFLLCIVSKWNYFRIESYITRISNSVGSPILEFGILSRCLPSTHMI